MASDRLQKKIDKVILDGGYTLKTYEEVKRLIIQNGNAGDKVFSHADVFNEMAVRMRRSTRYIKAFERILKSGSDSLKAYVNEGNVSALDASRLCSLSKEEQDEIVERLRSGEYISAIQENLGMKAGRYQYGNVTPKNASEDADFIRETILDALVNGKDVDDDVMAYLLKNDQVRVFTPADLMNVMRAQNERLKNRDYWND